MTLWGEEEINDTRICIHCGEEKHVSEMEQSYQYTAGKGVRNECVSCRKNIKKDLSRLKKEYAHLKPHITDICLICQRVGEDIHRANSQGYHKITQHVPRLWQSELTFSPTPVLLGGLTWHCGRQRR